MKLKISTADVDRFKNTLAAIVGLRKFCVLRFSPGHLVIVSASLNEPQVWCKISSSIFEVYEVESVRENIISMELNVESLYAVLRNFEKANSEMLHIRLQKKLANETSGAESSAAIVKTRAPRNDNSKRLASLAITYNEVINTSAQVNHSFKLPIRLLKKESDEKIVEPEFSSIDLLLKFPARIPLLFKRIERYRNARNLTICGDKLGNLSLILNEDDLKVELSWNEKMLVQRVSEEPTGAGQGQGQGPGKGHNDVVSVDVKLKDWKLGAKCCELCSNVVLILSHPSAVVLDCFLDDTDDIEIIYYISGMNVDGDE